MTAAAASEPEPYYVANFRALLEEVERRYADLLAPAEESFLADFRRLGSDARRLYVRLASRRGPWFRLDRLRYRDVDLEAAEPELVAAGFAGRAGAELVAERLARLRRDELHAWSAEVAPALAAALRRLGKGEAVALLGAATAGRGAELAARYPLLGLWRLEVLRVLRLLFFGNLNQDWTEFLLRDLGVLRFEAYALDAGARYFADRAALEWNLRLHDRREAVEALLAAGDLAAAGELAGEVAAAAGQPGLASRLRRRADAIVLAVGRALERRGDLADLERALALYAAADSPPARERRARLLVRRGRLAAAWALCREIAAAPRDEGERLFAARFAPRPAGGGAAVVVRSPRRRPALRQRLLRAGPGGDSTRTTSAETDALRALAAEGWRGFFAENWLWRSLFGLAFWEAVFAPVPGAFAHPFQHGPLDLEDGFREARAERVAELLARLAAEARPGPRLLALWERKFGTANRLVAFAPELRAHLGLAAEVLGGAQLAAVCERLSRDLRRYGRGFPDLFLVRDGEPLLAEVKAPGDRLRPEQEGWLRYLPEHGLPTVVVQLRRASS